MLVHGRPLVHQNEAFRRGRSVSQCAVRPDSVVVDAPLLDQDLRFSQRVKDFTVEQLVPESGVEAFAVPVFPG